MSAVQMDHSTDAYLVDMQAAAAVLWASGMFCTADIGALLHVREHAVDRTLRMARDVARQGKAARA